MAISLAGLMRSPWARLWPKGLCAWIAAVVCAAVGTAFTGYAVFDGTRFTPLAGDCARHDDLVVASGTDVSVDLMRRRLIQRWNSDPRHRHATLVEISGSADLQYSQMAAAEQSGSCAYDALFLDAPWTADFAARHYIQALPSPDGFVSQALAGGRWKGTQYAVPFNVDVGLLYYAGDKAPHLTWSRLLDRGYATQLADYEGLTVNALEVIANSGGDPLTGPTAHVDPGTIAAQLRPALNRLAGNVRNEPALQASRGYDETADIDAFASGQAALMRNWPYAYRVLAADHRMQSGSGRLKFGAEPLPGHSIIGGQNLAISAHSPHPDDARALIGYLTNAENQRLLFSCGGFAPGRLSALRPSAIGACPPAIAGQGAVAGDTNVPNRAQLVVFAHVIDQALKHTYARPQTPFYEDFSVTFRECVGKFLDGDPPDDQTFASALNSALNGRAAQC